MTAIRHVETDALAGLREELVRAAARRRSSRRRARRTLLAAALLLGLLGATAAAAEIAGFSTGVPEVDGLIGVEQRPGPAPGPGSASEPLSVRMGDGTYRLVAYLTEGRTVCVVYADRRGRGGFGGCPSLESVNRRVERRGFVWGASSHGDDRRTYELLVDGAVESIRPLGDGDWKVLMTPPWTPGAPGARPLRLAVVIDDADVDSQTAAAYLQPELELGYAK
jgi:hypothetical protein